MKRLFCIVLAGLALAWSDGVRAESGPRHPYRIYMALFQGWDDTAQGFKDYFRSRNIPVELIVRDAAQDEGKLKDFVTEVKALKPDLVFTGGTSVSLGMLGDTSDPDPQAHVTEIPAVFAGVSRPVASGLVSDPASSGRNITGTSSLVPVGAQLALIQSYRPLRKLGMIYNPLEKGALVGLDEIQSLTEKMDFTLVAEPVDVIDDHPDPSSIARKVEMVKQAGVDFLYIPPDGFLNRNRDLLTDACNDLRIPTFAASESQVLTSHALFGAVYRPYTVGQMTAYKAVQILQGQVLPQDIPIEAPKRLSILLNMPVVRELDLYPPMKMLRMAELLDIGSDH